MKRILASFFCILMLFALMGCGTEEDLTEENPEEERIELVLGSLFPIPDELRRDVNNFNRNNPDIYIRVLTYANWDDDVMQALQRLNADIVSGNMPDILSLGDLPFERYAHQGFLADIGALIDGDPDLSREDFVESAMGTLEVGGTLYAAASGFFIQTAVGRSDLVGPEMGWTMAEFLETMEGMPEGMMPFPPTFDQVDFIHFILGRNLSQFVDYETGEVSFDTALFRDYLAFAATFPDDVAAAMEAQRAEGRGDRNPHIVGESLLQHGFLWSFTDMTYLRMYGMDPNNLRFFDGDLTLIGYPSEWGLGSFLVPSDEMLGISANSPHQEAAWRFVRGFLAEERMPFRGRGDFSMNRAALERRAAEALAAGYLTYDAGPGAPEGERWPILEADVNQVLELISRLDQRNMHDREINEMMIEEILPFLAGDRSKEDTVRILQNRVQTYMSERR